MIPATRRRRGGRRRLVVVALLLLTVAAVAAAAVFALGRRGDGPPPDPGATVRAFVGRWAAQDLRGMYRMLAPRSRASVSAAGFAAAYRQAAATADLRSIARAGPMHRRALVATVPITAHTVTFGDLPGDLEVRLVEVDGAYRIVWSPSMVFPGLAQGERLERRLNAPGRRGAILSESFQRLAAGPPHARTYPQGAPFAAITGFVRAPQTPAETARRMGLGWPADRPYGQGGLEQSLDRELEGSPGILLQAVSSSGSSRLRAVHHGRRPQNVITTLSVPVQSAATDALGRKEGGIVVLDARTGAVRAAVGDALTALQPPGSTFKIVTSSAAFVSGKAQLTDTFPYERFAQIGGSRLKNFHHESCGGTLVNAFAQSCNSVFGPLADRVGAQALFSTAVRFGFNQTPRIAYPVPTSVMPRPVKLASDWDLAVTGIGQGGVDASPLQMAAVAQAIAHGGAGSAPWLLRRPKGASDARPVRTVVPPSVAAKVAEMMVACVSYGTGVAAQSSLATVAGKTGTAELGKGIRTDAWFVGFAPADAPRVVVAVMIVHGGVGGTVAAPIARQVIDAAVENPSP